MASIKRLPSGLWQAQIFRRGIRKSGSFESKTAAQAWAGQVEADIIAGSRGEIPHKRFGDLLDRYAREVSAKKKGARWEAVRIGLLKRDLIASQPLRSLGPPQVASWRDRRLESVSGASVRREWNLLAHACQIAVREWGWLKTNPFRSVTRPKPAAPRWRLCTPEDLAKLKEQATSPTKQQTYRAALFAIETGMRAGEILKCRVSGNVATLEDTKNGSRREVPLSAEAIRVYGDGFTLSSASLDRHFREMRDAAGIADLHFHDTRHTAITRLAQIFSPLELARIVGHKDLNVLLVYYNPTTADLAKRFTAPESSV